MSAEISLPHEPLRAPFPWFGGKSRAAPLIWSALGDCSNYVEPFAGSLAVLLARPTPPRVETCNDLDCFIANFWRAAQVAPDEVARWADGPVNEADLHARHLWLVNQAAFRARMRTDPDHFDAKVAGWWLWGICQWIGSGWCTSPGWTGRNGGARNPRGVHAAVAERRPRQKKPNIDGRGGKGLHAASLRGDGRTARPDLSAANGRGILTAAPPAQQLPDLSGDGGAAGRGIHASGKPVAAVYAWMRALADRLRRVRVCCGDWTRVLTPAVTSCIGVTGVLLDPPYAAEADRDGALYAHDDLAVAHRVREWAVAHGDDPRLRIVLCGYEGEHAMPPSWRCVAWKARGGYGNNRATNTNRLRERLWLSPHCLAPEPPRQLSLLEPGGAR